MNVALAGPEVVLVQALRRSSAYAPGSQEAVSDVLSLSIWDTAGAVVPLSGGNVKVLFTLNANANSPKCNFWSGTQWQGQPAAMLEYRSAGAAVSCNASMLGSFVILDTCHPNTTCSGNGNCRIDGSCSCQIGWTGQHCDLTYCDDAVFPCQNGGQCVCAAEPFDCMTDCEGRCSSSICAKKCPSVGEPYSSLTCPTHQGTRQTTCQCPCGYTGAHCETFTGSQAGCD